MALALGAVAQILLKSIAVPATDGWTLIEHINETFVQESRFTGGLQERCILVWRAGGDKFQGSDQFHGEELWRELQPYHKHLDRVSSASCRQITRDKPRSDPRRPPGLPRPSNRKHQRVY